VDDVKAITGKLDALIRLTAVGILGDRTGGEAIALLVRAGLDTEAIAEIVGTTPATVRAARSRNARKKARH
jgi:DNA-binding NarL/FixJ family response regulator